MSSAHVPLLAAHLQAPQQDTVSRRLHGVVLAIQLHPTSAFGVLPRGGEQVALLDMLGLQPVM